jgi:glycosyltransferase involved in cell wall biosynthesis
MNLLPDIGSAVMDRSAKKNEVSLLGPTRVLFVNHTARTGGGELALRLLIRHLDKSVISTQLLLFEDGPIADLLRGETEVHVFPLSDDVRETRKDTLGAIRIKDLLKLSSIPLFIARLSRKIGQLNVDVVHTNSLKADILGGIAARLAGKRVVWHVRDRIADDYLPAVTVQLFRRLARFIPHAIIANSHATLETLCLSSQNIRKAKKHSATVVHDGFDFSELPECERTHGKDLTVGLVGRISPWKGQDIFLQAVHLIRQEFPAVRFQIIGSALFGEETYADRLRSLAKELELDQCVEFCGFVRDIQRHISTLDILVHASTIPEPFGQVIIEGMAAAKPVIATRGGGATEIVVDGVSGLLVPMKNPEALANAMRKLLADQGLRVRIGSAGRQRVEDAFRIEATAAKISKVYSELSSR